MSGKPLYGELKGALITIFSESTRSINVMQLTEKLKEFGLTDLTDDSIRSGLYKLKRDGMIVKTESGYKTSDQFDISVSNAPLAKKTVENIRGINL